MKERYNFILTATVVLLLLTFNIIAYAGDPFKDIIRGEIGPSIDPETGVITYTQWAQTGNSKKKK